MYDLNLIPIHFQQGQAQSGLPGFSVGGPPKRAARSRSDDYLVSFLTINGKPQSASQFQNEWLEKLPAIFFKTGGSVTAALRMVIETLNLTLMEKNLKSVQTGETLTGQISMAVIHRDFLYVAHCGLTHTFVLNQDGLEHFFDPNLKDRGLGISRSPMIRYFQSKLESSAYLFMTTTPLESWTEENLTKGEFPDPDQLKRRLLNQSPSDFQLALVQISPGEGQIKLTQPNLRQREGLEDFSSVAVEELEKRSEPSELTLEEISSTLPQETDFGDTQEVTRESEQMQQETQAELQDMDAVQARFPEDVEERAQQPEPTDFDSGGDHPQKQQEAEVSPREENAFQEKVLVAREKLARRKSELQQKGLKGLAGFFKWWHSVWDRVETFFKDLIARWSPEDRQGPPQLSKRARLLIAIVVPFIVVMVATGVYFARGRALQYQHYYDQALASAEVAAASQDPVASRNGWVQVMLFLDKAEEYRETEEIKTLRETARVSLDILDGASRLQYRSAINDTLYSGIEITRIISFGADLYLFDADEGRILHAVRTSQGYDVNADFLCLSGSYEGGSIGPLVDMVSLPINNLYMAHVLGVDAEGNVIYCSPTQDPTVQSLPPTPTGEVLIERIAYNNGFLYALDRNSNQILVYRGSNAQFTEAPTLFFDNADPEEIVDLTQIVDLTANGPELYLLREDGYLVDCVSSGLASNPVNCENPVTYTDGRVGKEEKAFVMPETSYSSLMYTPPPEPSISFLDETSGDIYRFSVQFRLYQLLRPDLGSYEIDPLEATAFTISVDRIAFIAFHHQVFYAVIE